MISRSIRHVAALSLAGVSLAASAGQTSEWQVIGAFQQGAPEQTLATAKFSDTTGLATRFEPASAKFSLDSQVAADTGTMQIQSAQSDTLLNNPLAVAAPELVKVTLWNFILNIRAQQVNDPFQSLVTSSDTINYTIGGVPTPVPLPTGGWLFLMGLAGFAAWGRRAR